MMMKRLDRGKNTNEKWKDFYLDDIFSLHLAKGDNQPKNMSEGNIPVVSAGESNNGVVAFVRDPDEGSTFPKGTITVDMFGQAFWHGFDYSAVSHGRINILSSDFHNDTGCFISTCIGTSISSKYSYNYMCSQKRLTSQRIMLPTTNSGEPDYDYMAQYVSNVKANLLERYKNYIARQLSQIEYKEIPALNETKWNEFRLGDLFEVSRPKARNKDDYDAGDIPFVASGAMNNGVLKCCKIKLEEKLDRGNCITVSPVDGSSFYQPMDFLGRGGAGSSILILRNNTLNLFKGEFMARMIQQTCSKYNYGHMGNKDSIKRECIMLPVTDSGEPDYDYMEQYVKNMMLKKYQQYLDYLEKHN